MAKTGHDMTMTEIDAMWRFIGDEGRRLEAFGEDIQASARQHDLEAVGNKLRDIHGALRQLDSLFAELSN